MIAEQSTTTNNIDEYPIITFIAEITFIIPLSSASERGW